MDGQSRQFMLAKRYKLGPILKVVRAAYFVGNLLQPPWNKGCRRYLRTGFKSYPQKMWINRLGFFSS